MMLMEIKNMKKLMLGLMLLFLLTANAQANQEADSQGKWDGKSSISYEVVTIKPDMKIRPSIDPDTKVEFVIIRSIKLFDGSNGNGKAVVDLEIIDYKGNHTFKSCEKQLESGHDYFYEVVTEEMQAKGKIQK